VNIYTEGWWPGCTRTALSVGGDARTATGTWPRRCVSGRWVYRLLLPEVTGERQWDGGRRPLAGSRGKGGHRLCERTPPFLMRELECCAHRDTEPRPQENRERWVADTPAQVFLCAIIRGQIRTFSHQGLICRWQRSCIIGNWTLELDLQVVSFRSAKV
jgi:hypothetical protein